jgi:hypothetical protein
MKKIFITENQYKRIFLNEADVNPVWNPHIRMYTHPAYSDYVDVPKQFIYIKNSQGKWVQKYSAVDTYGKKQDVSIDDPDVAKERMKAYNQETFKKYIKNQTDGDKFRKWVNDTEFPERLKKVNLALKSNGLTGGFSISGPYDNNYMEIAFNSIGQFYLLDLDTKEKEKKEELKIVGQDVNNFVEYKYYLEALKTWNSSNKVYGWKSTKSVSSENIKNFLEGKISVSTCIDPKYILEKMVLLRNKMISNAMGQNKMSYEDANALLTRRTFDDKLKNYFKEIELTPPMKLPEIKPPSLFDDNGEQKIDYTGGLGHSYFKRVELAKTIQLKNQKSYEKATKDYNADKELKAILDKLGTEFKESLIDYNTYDVVLEKINLHNITISNQTVEKLENACEDPVYNVKSFEAGYGASGGGGSSTNVDETFKWSDACKNSGGIFMYPQQNINKTNGLTQMGIIGGKVNCCCVNPTGKSTVTVDGAEGDYSVEIDIKEWCQKSSGDVRGGLEKFSQWTIDCSNDWHCIADIASIVSLVFGPAGLIIGGVIDLVSAIGYVVEQDEGWKLNAGLTILGAFGGLGEAISLSKGGIKFSSKLVNLSKELKLVENDPILTRKLLKTFAEGLSEVEKKQFKNFGKVALSQDILLKFGKGGEFLNEVNKLSKLEQGILSDMLKKETPEEIQKLFKKSGKDLQKTVNSYFKGIKQVVIQGSLFAGMYVYSEEIGLFLKDLNDKYGLDPLGIFDGSGNINAEVDKNKNIDFTRIISNSDIKNLLKPDGSNSEFKSKFTQVSANYYELYLLSRKKMIDDQEILNLLSKLDKTIKDHVYGIGLNLEKFSQPLNIGAEVCKKIQENLSKEEIKKLLNEAIISVSSLPKTKIDNSTKEMILKTNNPNLSDDEVLDLLDLLGSPEDVKKDENNTPENPPQKVDENMKKLSEELKRMKSLFTDERLYGNLVNEDFATDTNGDGKIDEPEAVEFLRGKGYVLRAKSESDVCLRPGTLLKSFQTNYNSEPVNFELWNSNIGCALTVFRKNKIPGHFYKLNLFEGSSGTRFALYYYVGNANCCDTTVLGSYDFNAFVDKYDSNTYTFGVDLKYIKIEGFWSTSGIDFKCEDMVIKNLLDNKFNPVSSKISGGILTSHTDLGFRSNEPTQLMELQWMKDSTGNCIKVKDFVNQEMGKPYTDVFGMDEIIELLK